MLCVTRNLLEAGRELETGQLAQIARPCVPRSRPGVEAGTDGGCADVELVQLTRGPLHFIGSPLEAGGVAAELLAERHRHGVLQVRPSHLEHMRERTALGLERRGQRPRRRHEWPVRHQQREPSRRRKHVVRGLPHVDVIVRVNEACSRRACHRGARRRGWPAPR